MGRVRTARNGWALTGERLPRSHVYSVCRRSYIVFLTRFRVACMLCACFSDYGMVTILYADSLPGLQIFTDGVWKDVTPLPGALILNFGDMTALMTNDRYLSTSVLVAHILRPKRYRSKEYISNLVFFSSLSQFPVFIVLYLTMSVGEVLHSFSTPTTTRASAVSRRASRWVKSQSMSPL